MNQRKFGRTNLNVSELGLDVTASANAGSRDAAFEQLDVFHQAGGTLVQVSAAPMHVAPGASAAACAETHLADWISSRKILRDRLVIGCRFRFERPRVGGSIAFANLIRQQCEESLRRLHSTYVDFLVCDWNDGLPPFDDLIDALEVLTRAGYVRYLVANGFPAWRLVDALGRAAVRSRSRFEGVLAPYSLLQRGAAESELQPLTAEFRLGWLICQPVAGFTPGATSPLARRLCELGQAHDSSATGIALSWVLRNQQVSSVIVSPSAVGQMKPLYCVGAGILAPDEAKELTVLSE